MKYLKIISLLVVFFAFIQIGYSGSGNPKPDEVTIYYANWSESVAMVKVVEIALEDAGIPVKTVMTDPEETFAALARGDGDIMLEAWLPNTHKDYWKKYSDKLEKIGPSFGEASTGIVVPEYVDINSIDELNAHKDKFHGKIVGIGSGAGVHKDTERAIRDYNLDFEQVTTSGPEMLDALGKAVNNEYWVAVTGWKPHHKWVQYNLKYLDDPKGIYSDETSYILARKGFTAKYPGFKTFLENMFFDEILLYELMLTLETGNKDKETLANNWYKDRKTIIRSWMPLEWVEQ